MDEKSGLQEGLLGLGRNSIVQQILQHDADGIFRALREGGMAGDAVGGKMPEFTVEAGFHVLGALQGILPCLHHSLAKAGNGVGGNTAGDADNVLRFRESGHSAMPDSLFAADQRKVGIRAEAEQRCRVIGQVMLHILHAGLFVGAEKSTDGIAERDALFLQELQSVHADNGRALVINDATAQNIALPVTHGEGVGNPAGTGRHNVHMSDGGKILLTVSAEGGIADFIFAVAGVKTQLAADGESLIQSLFRARAEGGIFSRSLFHAVDCHKAGNVTEDGIAVGLNKLINP